MTTVTYEEPQLDLFDFGSTIYKRFLDFHCKFPIVYRLFETFSFQLINKGHKHLGAKMICERIRWECATQSKDELGFKINNDYIAHYARLFIQNNPQYKDYFEFRTIKTP